VVVTAAGMFLRNLRHAQAVHPGFAVDNAIVFTLQPQLLRGYDAVRVESLYRELLPRLRALPGVRAVTRASSLPLDGSNSSTVVFADGAGASAEDGIWTDYVTVEPGYHAVLGTPVLEGRDFEERDRTAPPSVVINRALADRLWPGESPVGKRLRDGAPQGDVYEVIGVTRTGKYLRLSEEAQPNIAFDLLRNPRASTTVLVRADVDPAALYPQVRRVVRELDPRLPLVGLKSLRAHISPSYAAAESGAFGAGVFAALALLLAAAGIYGVLSYAVAQRRREIGIRIALGAGRRDVVRLVLRGGGVLALLGIVLGSGLAALMGFALRSLMYDGSGHDPATLAAVCTLLGSVALLASWLPAWRAARVDPVLTMRT
jgi:predicted permease